MGEPRTWASTARMVENDSTRLGRIGKAYHLHSGYPQNTLQSTTNPSPFLAGLSHTSERFFKRSIRGNGGGLMVNGEVLCLSRPSRFVASSPHCWRETVPGFQPTSCGDAVVCSTPCGIVIVEHRSSEFHKLACPK